MVGRYGWWPNSEVAEMQSFVGLAISSAGTSEVATQAKPVGKARC